MSSKIKISIILIVIILLVLMIFIIKNDTPYTVVVNKIDDHSPARILRVYKDDKEISFKEIRYSDDVFLCSSLNPSVYYGDVNKEKKLKVVIDENNYIMAKIVEGGENEEK